MGIRSPVLSLILPLAVLACGQGGSPSAPSPPEPPGIKANIVATSTVNFGLCEVPSTGCSYSQEYANTGPGCANNLRGKVRVYLEQTLLESDDWWLDPSYVLATGETIPVEDCCFNQDTVRRGTRTDTELFWNSVPCS